MPIASGGAVHGAVRITYPTSELDRRVRNYWLVLAGIAAVVLAAAALIGLSFARWIRQPARGSRGGRRGGRRGRPLGARAPVPDAPPELRQLALEFNDMVARVDGLVSAQQEFVADASHELRTPLTALRLRLENLERHVGDDGRREPRRPPRPRSSASPASSTRCSPSPAPTRARRRPRPSTSPQRPAARIDAWQPAAARRPPASSTRTGPCAARAGADRVAQVIDNLVSNALRHAPGELDDRRHGDAGAAGSPSSASRDDGPGMTAEQKARAFDRFWRAGSGAGGSGLGLAIARRLVEVDGGTIELRDAPGGGLEVVVRLPAA